MSDTTGTCLCKKVTISAPDMQPNLGVCHCGMCRKWSGGPLFATSCGTNVTIDGEEFVGVYSSSDWAERGFCKNCGTSLFYRLKGPGSYMLSPTLFDRDDYKLAMQVFIDNKADFYEFANKTKALTSQEVLAQFAGK